MKLFQNIKIKTKTSNVDWHKKCENIEMAIALTMLFYLFVFFCAYVFGYNPFQIKNFARWDSGIYASISENGYMIETIEGKDTLNGNCGWFPLYPFLIFLLKKGFNLDFNSASLIICTVSIILINYMIQKIIELNDIDEINPMVCILFSLLFFGSIYLVAAFPMSLCIVLMVISVYFINAKKYFLSGIFCFLTCMTYSTAFLFCGALGLYIISEAIQEKVTFKKFIIRCIVSPVFGFMGFWFSQFIMFLYTGNYKSFFMTQKKYGHGLHNPFITLGKFLENLNNKDLIKSQESFIALMILIVFIISTYIFVFKKVYKTRICAFGYYSMLIIYIFLMVMGNGVSPYRQYLLCLFDSFLLASKYTGKHFKVLIIGMLFVSSIFEIKLFLTAKII